MISWDLELLLGGELSWRLHNSNKVVLYMIDICTVTELLGHYLATDGGNAKHVQVDYENI